MILVGEAVPDVAPSTAGGPSPAGTVRIANPVGLGADVEVYVKPAGAVMTVLPGRGAGSVPQRTVKASALQRDWVRITLPTQEEGWVRSERLRGCTAAVGEAPLMSGSRATAKVIATVPALTRLQFVAMRKGWVQVDYHNAEGWLVRGWLAAQSLHPAPGMCWPTAE